MFKQGIISLKIMEFLPEELLDIIFSYLSPYKEHNVVAMVCRKWNRVANSVAAKLPTQFEDGLRKGTIKWCPVDGNQKSTIPPRFGQSVCYCDFTRSLYSFGGGCALNSVTGFNDLLRLDMHDLKWSRPVVKGVIPPPKYGCCMQAYKRWLILFGGSSLSPTNTLWRGSADLSNDLHIYDTKTGTWKYKTFLNADCPPPVFHPSSCILDDEEDSEMDLLAVFGGHKMGPDKNEMWCLNLASLTWQKQTINGDRVHKLPFPDTSKGIFRVKIQIYSMALLLMDRSMFSAALLVRTGFNEWTYQAVEIAPSPKGFIPKMNAISGRNFIVIGETLVVLQRISDDSLPDYVPDLKTAKMGVSISPPNILKKTMLGLFLMDLKNIETEGKVQWTDQLNSCNKILPSFVRNVHLSELHVVEGRGEIILMGCTQSTKSTVLCTVGLQR